MHILWVYEVLVMKLRALAILDMHLVTEWALSPLSTYIFYCFINRFFSLKKNNFIAITKIINPYECRSNKNVKITPSPPCSRGQREDSEVRALAAHAET